MPLLELFPHYSALTASTLARNRVHSLQVHPAPVGRLRFSPILTYKALFIIVICMCVFSLRISISVVIVGTERNVETKPSLGFLIPSLLSGKKILTMQMQGEKKNGNCATRPDFRSNFWQTLSRFPQYDYYFLLIFFDWVGGGLRESLGN